MSRSTRRFGFFRTLLARPWRWGLLRGALVGGSALLAFALVLLLQVMWGAEPAPTGATALTETGRLSAGRIAEEWAQPGPAALSVEQDGTLDVDEALARFGANALYDGYARLMLASHDLPSPTATPTATAVPTSAPAPPPRLVEPNVPPVQVSAPEEEPAAPPAALPEATPTSQPPPPPPPPSPAPPACPTASMSAFAQALFDSINEERTQGGLPALALHGCVVYVARLRSEDMASQGYFAHTSPDGETAFSLLDEYGVPHGWAGENLARNNYPDDESVDVAIRSLMESDGHRANIMSANYTQMGVGAVDDGAGMKYFTMIFIGPP